MNVIGSRPDGWWRDRAAARKRLVTELAGAVRGLSPRSPQNMGADAGGGDAGSGGGDAGSGAGDAGSGAGDAGSGAGGTGSGGDGADRCGGGPNQVVVVFDGRHQAAEVARGAELGLEVVFAPGGPDAADRVIAEMVKNTGDPAGTVVVTSDRALAREVRAAGATVMGGRGVVAARRYLGHPW
ncbi:MAG: NYN domain-containing protein [Acidimicrobiales bacterium]